jgi:hypothetical protein
MVGPGAWKRPPPLQLLCMHNLFLFFSLFTNVDCPLSDKRVEQGPHVRERELFYVDFFLLPRGALFLLLPPASHGTSTLQRLGNSSLSRPFVPPTTNQRK